MSTTPLFSDTASANNSDATITNLSQAITSTTEPSINGTDVTSNTTNKNWTANFTPTSLLDTTKTDHSTVKSTTNQNISNDTFTDSKKEVTSPASFTTSNTEITSQENFETDITSNIMDTIQILAETSSPSTLATQTTADEGLITSTQSPEKTASLASTSKTTDFLPETSFADISSAHTMTDNELIKTSMETLESLTTDSTSIVPNFESTEGFTSFSTVQTVPETTNTPEKSSVLYIATTPTATDNPSMISTEALTVATTDSTFISTKELPKPTTTPCANHESNSNFNLNVSTTAAATSTLVGISSTAPLLDNLLLQGETSMTSFGTYPYLVIGLVMFIVVISLFFLATNESRTKLRRDDEEIYGSEYPQQNYPHKKINVNDPPVRNKRPKKPPTKKRRKLTDPMDDILGEADLIKFSDGQSNKISNQPAVKAVPELTIQITQSGKTLIQGESRQDAAKYEPPKEAPRPAGLIADLQSAMQKKLSSKNIM